MSDIAEARQLAQNLARNCGYHVFPCSEAKTPTWPKAKGGRGYKDASTDPDRIDWLWRRYPGPLIGVATGELSGFDVLDVDVKHASARAWLQTAQHRIPPTRTFQTRGGGFHMLFLHATGVRNTESDIAAGVDTRGTGGYMIYWFAAGFPCTDHNPAAEWPAWLLDALLHKPTPPAPALPIRYYRSDGRSAQNMVTASLRKLASAQDGQRHRELRAASCTIGGLLQAAGLSEADASAHLLAAVVEAGGASVDQQNALATIAWGIAKGTAAPIDLGGR